MMGEKGEGGGAAGALWIRSGGRFGPAHFARPGYGCRPYTDFLRANPPRPEYGELQACDLGRRVMWPFSPDAVVTSCDWMSRQRREYLYLLFSHQ